MREVKEKSPLKARAVETLKSAPQAAFRRGADASFQQLQQELREAAQDGQSQTPPIMPCGKSAVWQKKLSTNCRKRNLNRGRKSGRDLFYSTSSPDSPSSLLWHRKNIRLRLRDRATRHRASRR